MDAYTRLLDYGALGAILVIIFVGLGYFCWWLLRQFSPPKDATSKGGIFYEWINAHTESARKIGEVVPALADNQKSIADTQRAIGEGMVSLVTGQKEAADILGGYHRELVSHEATLISTIASHASDTRPAVAASLETAACMASIKEAGIHACIVAEMALKKLGVLEEAQPSLDKIRAALTQKGR